MLIALCKHCEYWDYLADIGRCRFGLCKEQGGSAFAPTVQSLKEIEAYVITSEHGRCDAFVLDDEVEYYHNGITETYRIIDECLKRGSWDR